MPRPKRTKVTTANPTKRVARSGQPSSTPARRNPTRAVAERVEDVSDDSEGLVTTSRRLKRRRLDDADEEDVTMTGGLGDGDVKDAHRASGASQLRAELSRIVRDADRDAADEELRKKKYEAKGRRGGDSILDMAVKDTPAPEDSLQSASTMEDSQNVSSPEVALRAHSTPAIESSVLAIGRFKRRSRQPSILRMVALDQAGNDSQADDADDLDDFNPEDESTPLKDSKSRSDGPSKEQDFSSSQLLPPMRSSKRQSTNSLGLDLPSSPPGEEIRVSSGFPSDNPASDGHSLPELSPRRQSHRQSTPELPSATMAPPQSSSPSNHVSRRKYDAEQPNLERPSGAVSPQPQKRGAAKRGKKGPGISTLDLQGLLPKRRRRGNRGGAAQDDFGIPSTDEVESDNAESDEDELSYIQVRSRGRHSAHPASKSRTIPKETTAKAKKTTEKQTKTYERHRRLSDKENEDGPSVYEEGDSLGPLPDDEEEPETGRRPAKPLGKKGMEELRAAAQKFKEVDNWSLDFEEVTASSSSPLDAR